jgi:hypothetical protein
MPKGRPAKKRETSAEGVAVAVIGKRGDQVGGGDRDKLANFF